MRILMVFDTVHGQTRKIVDYLAERFREQAHSVDVHDLARTTPRPNSAGYDRIVVASPLRIGAYRPAVLRFVREHQSVLMQVPSAFVSVSLSAASTRDHAVAMANLQKCVDKFTDKTGWHPGKVLQVAGALQYSRYGMLTRWIMKKIATAEGQETDPKWDYEYTDWSALAEFADDFVAEDEAAAPMLQAA
jgi:menaquinone-dependent protoporphyrinogen oxidase